MQSRQHLNLVEEVGIEVGALVETFGISGCPPIAHVALVIILATLIVETMRHLVTNDHTDGTIIKGFVGLGIEEWILQNACREANLVGRGVVISVHRLRCHAPLISVYGLSGFLGNLFVVIEFPHGHHVVIETLPRVDGQTAVVGPLVGIANLHIKLVELLVGVSLSRIAHPGLRINTFAKTDLQILHQLLHHLL